MFNVQHPNVPTFNVQRSTFTPPTFQRSTLNAQRSTPQRSTFNVQRSTFNAQRSTFNAQRSTFNAQRSTFNAQRSTLNTPTFNIQRSTLNAQRSTFNVPTFNVPTLNAQHPNLPTFNVQRSTPQPSNVQRLTGAFTMGTLPCAQHADPKEGAASAGSSQERCSAGKCTERSGDHCRLSSHAGTAGAGA